MYIKFAIPKIRTMIFPGIFRKKKDEVHYIGGAEVLRRRLPVKMRRYA